MTPFKIGDLVMAKEPISMGWNRPKVPVGHLFVIVAKFRSGEGLNTYGLYDGNRLSHNPYNEWLSVHPQKIALVTNKNIWKLYNGCFDHNPEKSKCDCHRCRV